MIVLNRTSKKPLYAQIYEHIRQEIISGELEEGHRLSATRAQAETLGVSRNTVEQAYLQLCSEGYLENKPGSGYYIKHVDASLADSGKRYISFHKERSETNRCLYDMKYGNCHIENFPLTKWRKAMDRALMESEGEKLTAYGDNCGDWELRNHLAEYLDRARGVTCSPDQIVIGSGTQFLIGLLCQLIKPRSCAVEEPGYDGVRYVLQNHEVAAEPIQVNQTGMDIELLKRQNVQAVYVTPSHQFPMGAVMPIQTRMELLKLAEEKDFYLIEDDYDSIFRYEARAIPSMQGLDQNGRVIYLGGVSKALAPSLRLSYMVLPAKLKDQYDMWFSEYHNTVSSVLQEALRLFMKDGGWDRHVRKICLINRRKHDTFFAELERGLGPGFRVLGKGAGLHLIIESFTLTAEEMIVRIQQQGVRVYSMERYFALGSKRNLVMAGYGGIRLADIKAVAQRMIRALKIGPKK